MADQDDQQTSADQGATQSDQSADQSQQTTDDQSGGQQATDAQTGSQASQSDEQTLKDPVVTVVADNTEEIAPAEISGEQETAAAEGAGAGIDVVNLGKFVWDVVKDNVPVTDQKSDNASAVPKGASFTDLGGWAADPKSMKLHYHMENYLGRNPTDIDIICEWYYNGNYKGSGQFINAATVYASVDSTSWGSTINIKASIDNPMNMGKTQALAVLPVRITLQQSNKLQSFTTVYSGQVKGNGGGYLKEQ